METRINITQGRTQEIRLDKRGREERVKMFRRLTFPYSKPAEGARELERIGRKDPIGLCKDFIRGYRRSIDSAAVFLKVG